MILNHRLRLGLPLDPWGSAPTLATADGTRVVEAVRAAAGRALVQIVGRRGTGKTRMLRAACRDQAAVTHVVETCRPDRERLHIGDVATAIVYALSDEPPRHGGEARAVQVRRLLGRHARDGVLLVVDDAHKLHAATLCALKRLHELAWRGEAPLLGVVIAGQADRAGMVPEVGLRTATVALQGLAASEAERAISAAMGPVCPPEAAARIAADPRARNWLELERLVDDCLAETVVRSETAISMPAVDAVLAPPTNGTGSRSIPASADEAPAADAVAAVLDAHEAREPGHGRRRMLKATS